MHAVKPYWVSRTRLRCQAITVLISLQLCLLISLEAVLHSKAIYNHVATFAANGDISSGRRGGGVVASKNTFDSVFLPTQLPSSEGGGLKDSSWVVEPVYKTFWIESCIYYHNSWSVLSGNLHDCSICLTASKNPLHKLEIFLNWNISLAHCTEEL